MAWFGSLEKRWFIIAGLVMLSRSIQAESILPIGELNPGHESQNATSAVSEAGRSEGARQPRSEEGSLMGLQTVQEGFQSGVLNEADLDQAVPVSLFFNSSFGNANGQTVRVGRSGRLTQVALGLRKSSAFEKDLRLYVARFRGDGTAEFPLLADVGIPQASIPTEFLPYLSQNPTNLVVVSFEEKAIGVLKDDLLGFVIGPVNETAPPSRLVWAGGCILSGVSNPLISCTEPSMDIYPAGHPLILAHLGLLRSSAWSNPAAFDLYIRTYVEKVEAPLILKTAKSQTFTKGRLLTLSASVVGSEPLSFQWLKNESPIPSATFSTLQIANAQAAHEGTYVLLVTNRFGSARTEPAIVRVQEGSDFLVTSLADDGVGTLRDAMRGASSIAGGRITFSNVFGKIHLQAPLPEIKSDLSVIGPGPDQVQVSGADLFSVFKVVAGNVLISGLTITEGFGATGGGVVNSANLTLSNCVIAANSAIGPGGGGIANSGNLKVISSLVLSNSASGVDVPTYSMGSDVPTSAFGGGIHHSGSGLLISNSIIAGNAVRGGNGGGVEGVGYFQGAPSYGGGISIHGGTVHLVSSTIHANAAFGGRGAPGGTSSGGHGAEAAGGGLWTKDGWIGITNCTFSMNLAKGGNGGSGFFGGGNGGNVSGGGIALSSGSGAVVNCTIWTNQTEGGANGGDRNGGGGWFAFSSGGGLLGGSNFLFRNTIVAGNFPNDVAAQMNSGGHNLIGNSRNLTGLHSTDLTNVNARLGPLQPNGRFTPTHLPLPGSPAIDAGSQFGAPPLDQRGVRRPVGKGVDIGACEYEPITLTAKSAAGSLILLIQGPIDYRYGIERSANLLDWTLAATLDGGSGGLEWRESSAFDQSVRFYRAVVVGP